MRRFAAGLVVVPVLLVTAGCGSGDSAPPSVEPATLADVTVTGSPTATPKVEFHAPLTFKDTTSKVIDEGAGNGATVGKTSIVTVDYLAINARDDKVIDSSYDRQPATFGVDQVIPGFAEGLAGAQAGDRVLIGVASKDGYDPTGSRDQSVLKGDSLVFVVDLHKVTKPPKPLTEAKGKTVAPPADVPKLTFDKEGHPEKFVATPGTAKAPEKLGVYPVIEGTGPKVQAGQSITVEYVGQIYPDGKVFDESWSRSEPVAFPIGQGSVIKGWDEGLVGQKVGSRVILVIPSELGYGEQGQGDAIPPNSDLIFAVDILQAS